MNANLPRSMKVVILAGGLGSRLAEETDLIPKPMVEIGGKPILWHILKHYGVFGCREFLIALGYKGDVIKRYFLDFPRVDGDLSVDLSKGVVGTVSRSAEDWLVHLLDTGVESKTGGRLKRLEPWLKDAPFMLTYGDGVSSIDLDALAAYKHEGFWQCMDTLRDKRQLESLWQAGRAPWQLWQ